MLWLLLVGLRQSNANLVLGNTSCARLRLGIHL
jgi:hypothetical protein